MTLGGAFNCRSLAALEMTLAIACLTRTSAGAQAAYWIAPPGVPGDSFVVFHARRVFTVPSAPKRFVVHVSADNRYRLYVNGALASSGPQRSDVAHWRYETVDLAPQLRAGRNVVAAVVWNWGAARPVAQHSHRTGFLVQGESASESALINTGPGWKLVVDSAYRPIVITNATVAGYYAGPPGEAVEAASYPWGWERPDYDDSRWFGVVAPTASGPAAPLAAFDRPPAGGIGGVARHRGAIGPTSGEVFAWQLEPRSIPAMDESVQRLTSVRRATLTTDGAFLRAAGELVVPAHATATLLLDQSHTTNAYPVIEVSGGAGRRMTMTYAEALVDSAGGKGNRNDVDGRTIRGVHDVFLPDGGAHRVFQTLYWRSFRYVQLEVGTAGTPLVIHDMHGVCFRDQVFE